MDLVYMGDNILFNYRQIRGLRGVGGQEVCKIVQSMPLQKTGLNLSEKFSEIPEVGTLPFFYP